MAYLRQAMRDAQLRMYSSPPEQIRVDGAAWTNDCGPGGTDQAANGKSLIVSKRIAHPFTEVYDIIVHDNGMKKGRKAGIRE